MVSGGAGFTMISGDKVYCDCCGLQVLAQIVGDKLVIKDRRHGEKHMVVIPIRELLDKISETSKIKVTE